ncbi:MAG: glycosyltransferase family 2 protein [Holophagae bacterium]|nr:glycosyltransferase family 2 protein [Holophagae bacterium]
MPESGMELSIVIPIYNEEENIVSLVGEILNALKDFKENFEVVLVDDGSKDNSLPLMKQVHKEYPDIVQYVSFTENNGQTAAFIAGFRASRGRLVATLDGDRQNDPSDLPGMIEKLNASDVDMVNGIRRKRQDNWVRKFSSKIGNGFRNWLTKEQVSDVGCSIRVMKRECVAEIPCFNGLHRFFPTLVRMKGFKITEIPVNHRERTLGVSKYGVLNRAFVGFHDTLAVRWMLKRVLNWQVGETTLEKGKR